MLTTHLGLGVQGSLLGITGGSSTVTMFSGATVYAVVDM